MAMQRKQLLLLVALAINAGANWAQMPAKPPTVTYSTPVFSQIVVFQVPAAFRTASERNTGISYLLEAIPARENMSNWTQMVSLHGFKDTSGKEGMSPATFSSNIAAAFKKTCPKSYRAEYIGPLDANGHPGHAIVVGCGVSPSARGGSEKMLSIAIQGSDDMYVVQWAVKGPAEEVATFNPEEWTPRLKQLMPIKVCDRLRGEPPPYSSCVNAR